MRDRSNSTADTQNALARHMVEIEREQGVCLDRDLLAQGFSQADLDFYGEQAKRLAAEIKARNVRVLDTYATDEDARHILGMKLGDLLLAAKNPDPAQRRDFVRRARNTARTLEAVPVCGTRPHPYAARLLVELAARAEQA